MTHEPLRFRSGTFKWSQQWWATVDKKGFAMVSAFKWLEYVLWNGVYIYTDHKNLAYIFDPDACVSSVAKMTTPRLDQWRAVLAQYDYTIMHIAGDRNFWRDLLSQWLTVPAVSVHASAVYAASEPDETLPSKQAIRDAHHALRANLGTLGGWWATLLMTDNGQVTLDDEELFRLQANGRAVLWIPGEAKKFQV